MKNINTLTVRKIFRRRYAKIVWQASQPHPEWQQVRS